MSMTVVCALLAGMAVGALRWLPMQRPIAPAASPREIERIEPRLMGPHERLKQLKAERLQHVETYVLAAKFADWMRENGETGVYLPHQIDDYLGIFCDAKNYCLPKGIQFRSALALSENQQSMHGVTRKRVWRTDPLFDGLQDFTDAQRPHLYIIHKTKPGTRIYEPIVDVRGPASGAVASGSNEGLGHVQTRDRRPVDGVRKAKKNRGRHDPYAQQRGAAC